VAIGSSCRYVQVVLAPAILRLSSTPLATTWYAEAVVIAILYAALRSGRSSQGNQDGAPIGWLATSTPSVSCSQPRVPKRLFIGLGAPL
jgi:hypothetical protein